MAETVTWDRLRELAEFRAEKGCAISLYLDLDPSIVPTAGDADARVSSLLGEGRTARGSRRPRPDARPASCAQGRLRPDPRVLRERVRPRRRAGARDLLGRARQRLASAPAHPVGAGQGPRRPGVPPGAARAARRPRRRRDRRGRQPRTGRPAQIWPPGGSARSPTGRSRSRVSTTRAGGRSPGSSATSRSSSASICARWRRSSTGGCGR